MAETNSKHSPSHTTGRKNLIVGYIFSAISLCMFIYVFSFEQDSEIRQQAIYWFVLSIASALLPSIQQMKYGDLELSFLRISEEVSEIKKQVITIEEKFFQGADWFNAWHASLSEEELKERTKMNQRFATKLGQMKESERLFEQERITRLCLFELCLSISSVKSALGELGYFEGDFDDAFTKNFADAVIRFQRDNEIDPVDGIYGGLTHRVLAPMLRNRQRVPN